MNKTHRIVWSESRQAFIVAPEKASARGKSSSTRTVVAQAVTAALLALGGLATGPAAAGVATDICTTGVTGVTEGASSYLISGTFSDSTQTE